MPWYVYNYTASKERKRLIKDDRKMFVKRLGYYRKAAYNLINQNNPQIISNKLEIKA